MNFKVLSRSIVLALVAVVVAACGGGGSGGGGGNDGGDGGGGDKVTFDAVESEVKYVSDTTSGQSFWESTQHEESSCGSGRPNDRYLETDKTVIYGSGDVSEENLQRLANAIHHYYPSSLKAMGKDESDIDNQYLSATINHFILNFPRDSDWQYIEDALSSEVSFSGTIENSNDVVNEFVKLSPVQLENVIRQAIANVPDELAVDHDSLMEIESFETGSTYEREYRNPKIVGCVDDNDDPSKGAGNLWGLSVNKNFEAGVASHELVHYVQKRLAGGLTNFSVPRWFLEGQAVSVSGQFVSDSLGDHNPVEIESLGDERDAGVNAGDLYGQYGLAYEYISAQTSPSEIGSLIEGVYMSEPDSQNRGRFVDFYDRFNNTVVDPSGDPLNYSDYQNEWEQRIQDYL